MEDNKIENQENQKEAINIGITLSTQLIASALTMITVVAAIIVFIVEKREVTATFYVITFLSFASFVTSIFFGGKGINAIREQGFNGSWSLNVSKRFFNAQAGLSLLGLLLILLSAFIGENKKEVISDDVVTLMKVIEYRDALAVSNLVVLKNEIDSLKQQLHQIEIKYNHDKPAVRK